MIAQTYVQVARMKWKDLEAALEGFSKDRHVWYYVKGVLRPLVLKLKERLTLDYAKQIKHEEAVQRFIETLDKQLVSQQSKGFVFLKKKQTDKWKAIEKLVFMKAYLVKGSRFEEVWEIVKLIKTIVIIWLVPLMLVVDVGTDQLKSIQDVHVLGGLTLIGFIATYMDWHTPYWLPETGVIVTSPPIIFKNWLKTWSLQHVLMKFPFDLFFIWSKSNILKNAMRALRLWHWSGLITKLARIKDKRRLKFGIMTQVFKLESGLYIVLHFPPSPRGGKNNQRVWRWGRKFEGKKKRKKENLGKIKLLAVPNQKH